MEIERERKMTERDRERSENQACAEQVLLAGGRTDPLPEGPQAVCSITPRVTTLKETEGRKGRSPAGLEH